MNEINEEKISEKKRSKDGTLVKELEKNDQYSLAYGELLPGEKNKEHIMETQEIYYILNGRGIINVDGKKEELKKDSIIIVPAGKKQKIVNTGKRKLRFLMIVNPPYDEKKEKITEE